MSQYALYCSARITTMFINSKSISKLKKKLLQWGKLRNDEKMFHIH